MARKARSSITADPSLIKDLKKLQPLLRRSVILTQEEVVRVLVDEKMEALGLKKKVILA